MITTQFEKFYEVKIWKSFINQRPDRLPHVLGQLIVSILVWYHVASAQDKKLKKICVLFFLHFAIRNTITINAAGLNDLNHPGLILILHCFLLIFFVQSNF